MRLIYFVSSLVLMSACTTLPQAPLIYTSKTTFGVELGSDPSPATPVGIAIGVKLHDAAYVPVVVGSERESLEVESFENEHRKVRERTRFVELKDVSSSHRQDEANGDDTDDESELENEEAQFAAGVNQRLLEIEKLDAQINEKKIENSREVASLARNQKSLTNDDYQKNIDFEISIENESIQTRKKEIAGLKSRLKEELSEEEKETLEDNIIGLGFSIQESLEYISFLEGKKNDYIADEAQKAAEKAEIEQRISQTEEDIQGLIDDKEKLINEIRIYAVALQKRSDNRKDAYSVYGSFSSSTCLTPFNNAQQAKQSKGHCSNRIGKVFSTGLASQNLTKGIEEATKEAARKTDVVRCLQAVSEVNQTLDDGKKMAGDMIAKVCSGG